MGSLEGEVVQLRNCIFRG